MRSSPGAYVLIVFLPAPATIRVGSLGQMTLDQGHYLYCGSAQAGLMPRLSRHMRSEKKCHWHIDFLTSQAMVVGALTFYGEKEMECRLAGSIREVPGVEPVGHGFGSSDCGCPTHLFHLPSHVPLSLVLDILRHSFSERVLDGQSI
ncbi:MAG TPA: GIY-YIG nuclease family protein [Methanomassiliicoccales archaeon]|nr:GIY-YIG nuclease family protein [Methanomassiliicoccales archaeon]